MALLTESTPSLRSRSPLGLAAYAEAIQPSTTPDRREVLRQQLERYCQLDTYAMVRLWQFLSGKTDLRS